MGLIADALHLHGQPEHLQEQHSYQDDQIAVSAEDGFHNTKGSGIRDQQSAGISGFWSPTPAFLFDRDFSQQLEVREHLTGAQNNAA